MAQCVRDEAYLTRVVKCGLDEACGHSLNEGGITRNTHTHTLDTHGHTHTLDTHGNSHTLETHDHTHTPNTHGVARHTHTDGTPHTHGVARHTHTHTHTCGCTPRTRRRPASETWGVSEAGSTRQLLASGLIDTSPSVGPTRQSPSLGSTRQLQPGMIMPLGGGMPSSRAGTARSASNSQVSPLAPSCSLVPHGLQ